MHVVSSIDKSSDTALYRNSQRFYVNRLEINQKEMREEITKIGVIVTKRSTLFYSIQWLTPSRRLWLWTGPHLLLALLLIFSSTDLNYKSVKTQFRRQWRCDAFGGFNPFFHIFLYLISIFIWFSSAKQQKTLAN